MCLQLFSQKRAAKNSKLMSGDKTPRGGEEKPNFVVIDLTAVNVVPGKNVYSLTFKVMCRVNHCKCSNSHTAALKEPLHLLQVVD